MLLMHIALLVQPTLHVVTEQSVLVPTNLVSQQECHVLTLLAKMHIIAVNLSVDRITTHLVKLDTVLEDLIVEIKSVLYHQINANLHGQIMEEVEVLQEIPVSVPTEFTIVVLSPIQQLTIELHLIKLPLNA
jgi:hypothetical protein